ncbi:reverse transcriptase-like protein [bacterium]|nr:reverse transcriptase-like protein [bacterium]
MSNTRKSAARSRDMQHLNQLIEEIRRLSSKDRRRLFRHAQLVGLLDLEDLLTDRDALRIVPAVPPTPPKPVTAPVDAPKPAPSQPSAPGGRIELKTPQSDAQTGDGNYRSSVSGRVVMGTPQKGAEEAPLAMRPLPGQAPEQPIKIIFDGGSKGNPGQGYGSYALDWPAYPRQVVRLQFGNHVTNNEAEYDTLIAALEAVEKRLAENGANPGGARIEIWGDSQLVINQVKGEWQTNKPELRVRRDKARALLEKYGSARLHYHDRSNNVEVLGH